MFFYRPEIRDILIIFQFQTNEENDFYNDLSCIIKNWIFQIFKWASEIFLEEKTSSLLPEKENQ